LFVVEGHLLSQVKRRLEDALRDDQFQGTLRLLGFEGGRLGQDFSVWRLAAETERVLGINFRHLFFSQGLIGWQRLRMFVRG